MKKIMCLACLLAVAAAAEGKKPQKTTPEPAPAAMTLPDSLSYYIGQDMGESIKKLGEPINVDMLAKGMRDAQDSTLTLNEEERYAFLQEYFMVRKPAMERRKSEEFLASVAMQPGVQKTPSGLLYQILSPGGEQKVVSDDEVVKVDYVGKLPDGTTFDSSFERGESAELTLGHVIPGWIEGMKLVGKGGKIKLWIPSDLAYGAQGAGETIKPFQTVVFEVDLLDILPPAPVSEVEEIGVAEEIE